MNIGEDNNKKKLSLDNQTEQIDTHSRERILFMDESLAVFNKLPGEICESWTKKSSEAKEFYVPEVFMQCLDNSDVIPQFCQCFNRLDRPVSGAVILIFNRDLISVLQNQFTSDQKDHKFVKKIYWGIVEGIVPKMDEFRLLEHFIRFDGTKKKAYIHNENIRKSKPARLLWRSLGHGERYSFVETQLLTGRTHQIRAQLANIGLHIKGDVKYGARRQDTLPGIRLHAKKLCFMHPKTKKRVEVSADLPQIDPLWDAFSETVDTMDA